MSATKNQSRDDRKEPGGAQGQGLPATGQRWRAEAQTSGSDKSPRASACFLWLDEETGDELSVEVRGNEAFFQELESIGFERQLNGGGDSRQEEPESSGEAGSPSMAEPVERGASEDLSTSADSVTEEPPAANGGPGEESTPRGSRSGRLRASMDVIGRQGQVGDPVRPDDDPADWPARRGA